MKASRLADRGLGLFLTGFLLFGCTDKSPPTATEDKGLEETVAAGEPEFIPGQPVLARYWVEMDARNGRMELFEIKPGNKINRVETQQQAIRYTYSGTGAKDGCLPANNCVPGASQVRLWTDQTKVSYHPQNMADPFYGFCRQASTSYPRGSCPNFPAGSTTCDDDGVFCGPVQIVSNYPYALPNVIIRVRNPNDGATPVTQCHEHGANNSFGRCQENGLAKIDPTTSNLAPTISGCAYCYGNATNVDARQMALGGTNMSGLKNVVLPTNPFDQSHATLNTDVLAMRLASDASAPLVLEVRYSVPSFNTTGELTLRDFPSGNCVGANSAASCVTVGTTCAVVAGGGFGPPTNCFAQLPGLPTAACASALNLAAMSTTTPHAGYALQFAASGGTFVSGTGTLWTDNTLRTTAPAGMNVVAGSLRVVTPAGNATVPTPYTMCATTNSWRTLTNGLPAGRIDPAGGVVGAGAGARIVVAGGRVTGSGTSDAGQVTTYLLPIPASAMDSPAWATMASYNMVVGRWGAAYGVHNQDLYAFGGASNGSCLSSGERFDDGTLTWIATAAMPAAVCQARAVVSGQYIIVSGGMTAPWTSFNDFDLFANTDTFVYDTATNMWATFSAGGQVDPAQRFAAAGTTGGGGIIIGGGDFVDASSTNAVTTVGGGAPPAFTAQAVMGLTARASAAVGYVSSGAPRYFLFGGILASADADSAATNQLWTATVAAPASWSQPAGVGGSAPSARAGHVYVAATGGDGTIRLYAIGGHNAGTLVSAVDEYTPAP